MTLLLELLAATPAHTSGGGGLSLQAILGLVAGSTVLGGILGAYAQSSRQREEKFRERMIEASVDFLGVIGEAQSTARQAALSQADPVASEEAIARTREALADAWARVPILLVVFPNSHPGDAAEQLIKNIEGLVALLGRKGSDAEYQQLRETVATAHRNYAAVVNRSIRARAFGRGVGRLTE